MERGGSCGGNAGSGERGTQGYGKATTQRPYERRDLDKRDSMRSLILPVTILPMAAGIKQ